MTKSEIICLLRNLRPAQIKDIVVVYHNPTKGFLFMDLGSVLNEFALLGLLSVVLDAILNTSLLLIVMISPIISL